ncbi:MAG: tetratricopeptide repeat protein [Gammaproteobacteria bacterium]|nr:tetratricopeptide repeat protein [Gammaproteobacteria bacterium]
MSESRYSCGLLPTRILPLFLCVCWPVLLPAQIETDPALLPIPEPDLELLQPATQVKLSRAQDYFHHTAPSLDGRLLAEAYGKLGMVYQALQLQAAAKAAYSNAIILDPDAPQWPFYLAIHHEEVGELAAAAKLYSESLTIAPQMAGTWLRFAEVLLETGDLLNSENAFRRTLSLERGQVVAIAGLGTIALRREQYRNAINAFEAALRIQPEATQLHYRLAMAYRNLGNRDQAIEHLSKSGKRIPSSFHPWIELMKAREKGSAFYLRVGRKAASGGDYRRAMAVYSLALEIDPENLAALYNLAATSLVMGNRDRANGYLERALELAPNDQRFHDLRVRIQQTRDGGQKSVEDETTD